MNNYIFYYVLKDKSFSDYIISTAQGSANQASITLKSILDYDLPNIDSKEKRIKIGKTLATYDEKSNSTPKSTKPWNKSPKPCLKAGLSISILCVPKSKPFRRPKP